MQHGRNAHQLAYALEALARRDGHDADIARLFGQRRSGRLRQPDRRLLRPDKLLILELHVLDDHRGDVAQGDAILERLPGVIAVHVHLDRLLIAHHQHRIAQGGDVIANRGHIEALALDDELGVIVVLALQQFGVGVPGHRLCFCHVYALPALELERAFQ